MRSLKDEGDPYFAQQKQEAKNVTNDIVRAAILVTIIAVVLVICLLAIILIVAAIKFKTLNIRKALSIFSFIDGFSLKHMVKPNDPLINTYTPFGGLFSIILGICVVGIVIITILDTSNRGNKIETALVVPREVVNISKVHGFYAVYMNLHNYGDKSCELHNQQPDVENFVGTWSSSVELLANYTCKVVYQCPNCSLSGSSQSIGFKFAQPYSMATAIDYTLTLPYFFPNQPIFNISERILPNNSSTVFRGASPTVVSMSLTTTLYTTIDTWDFFLYNILSKVFSVRASQESFGFSVVRNPPVQGSVANEALFWQNEPTLRVQFQFYTNPNGYMINQQGKSTILDFVSKVAALSAAIAGILAFVMSNMEWCGYLIGKCIANRKAKKTGANSARKIELLDMPAISSAVVETKNNLDDVGML